MIINAKLYSNLIKGCYRALPEMGGFLGGSGEQVTRLVFDYGKECCNVENKSDDINCYHPDEKLFYSTMLEWEKQEIDFLGIFHTHLVRWPGLSGNDKEYINRLLESIGVSNAYFFFPIVYPENQSIQGYKAIKRNGVILYLNDTILVEKHTSSNVNL